jgi:DNA invertase Pin-like site-specific DNA recombinase
MEDAGLWVRVSGSGQDEQNQVPDLERYCAAHDYNIARRYEVHAKSASKGMHQTDLSQAVADMRDGIIKVLVIWHSDRIERRPGKQLLDTLAEFSTAGGRVESVKEPNLGLLDFGSQVTTFIAGLVNHEKSKHISEQVAIGHARIDANRAFRGKIPFGYKTEGPKYSKRLVPTEQGRALIPVAYQMIIDGKSSRDVAAFLAEKTGRAWWGKIVIEMIRRPTYKGRHEYTSDGILHTHKCEQLVNADTWKRANDSLNARPKRGKVYAENRAMLSGVLTCAGCGAPMYRVSGGAGTLYYRCNGRGPARKGCGNMARADLVDNAVNAIIAKTFSTPVLVRRLIPGHDHSAELAEVRYDMQQLPLRGLPRAEEDAERNRLRDEEDRLLALPSVPDRWEEVPNGHTYAGVWAELSTPERGPWLASHGFRVTADKTKVTVSRHPAGSGELTGTVSL